MTPTEVFEWNLEAYLQAKGKQTLIVNQGGQGSSKTVSILQLLVLIALKSPKKLYITIASYALTHLRGGALRDFENILSEEGFNLALIRNRSESRYYIGKCEIEFVGIEGNEARATGPRRDILYINEANKRITYQVFELMNARTRLATFIDFNPSAEFWFHKEVQPLFPHILIKSTYLNNRFLPERERENILSKKDKPGFENWWKVYGLGELGQLAGAIFTNWKFGKFDETLVSGYGLDFGVRDPDALVKIAVDKKNKKIYVKEELYESDLSTDALALRLGSRVQTGKLIVADSSAARTIKDLGRKGFNIKAVEKGRIVDDIKELIEYELIVDPTSFNLERELNTYIWLDRRGEVPIDENNHLLDAFRYIAMFFIRPKTRKGHRHVA